MDRFWTKVRHIYLKEVVVKMPWYVGIIFFVILTGTGFYAIVASSKRAGLNSFQETGLSKSVAAVYNRFMATVGRRASPIRARIQQSQDDCK